MSKVVLFSFFLFKQNQQFDTQRKYKEIQTNTTIERLIDNHDDFAANIADDHDENCYRKTSG